VTYTEALYFVRQLAQETATPAPTIKTLALSVADLAAMDYDALSYALFDYEAEQRRLSQPTGE
jgi:hypothetical protein